MIVSKALVEFLQGQFTACPIQRLSFTPALTQFLIDFVLFVLFLLPLTIAQTLHTRHLDHNALSLFNLLLLLWFELGHDRLFIRLCDNIHFGRVQFAGDVGPPEIFPSLNLLQQINSIIIDIGLFLIIHFLFLVEFLFHNDLYLLGVQVVLVISV